MFRNLSARWCRCLLVSILRLYGNLCCIKWPYSRRSLFCWNYIFYMKTYLINESLISFSLSVFHPLMSSVIVESNRLAVRVAYSDLFLPNIVLLETRLFGDCDLSVFSHRKPDRCCDYRRLAELADYMLHKVLRLSTLSKLYVVKVFYSSKVYCFVGTLFDQIIAGKEYQSKPFPDHLEYTEKFFSLLYH